MRKGKGNKRNDNARRVTETNSYDISINLCFGPNSTLSLKFPSSILPLTNDLVLDLCLLLRQVYLRHSARQGRVEHKTQFIKAVTALALPHPRTLSWFHWHAVLSNRALHTTLVCLCMIYRQACIRHMVQVLLVIGAL